MGSIAKAIQRTGSDKMDYEDWAACVNLVIKQSCTRPKAAAILDIPASYFRVSLIKGKGGLDTLKPLTLYGRDVFWRQEVKDLKTRRETDPLLSSNHRPVDPLNLPVLKVGAQLLDIQSTGKSKTVLKKELTTYLDDAYDDIDWENMTTEIFLQLISRLTEDTAQVSQQQE